MDSGTYSDNLIRVNALRRSLAKEFLNDCLNSVYGGGKVVGEWVCDKTIELPCETTQPHWLKEKTCLSDDEYIDYLGHKDGKGLYIAKPKRYDTPKALSKFRKPDEPFHTVEINENGNVVFCDGYIDDEPITRPPQSWMYVEEIEE